MPLAKFRFVAEKKEKARDQPRLADELDSYVESPVHRLRSELTVLEKSELHRGERPFPGWFRVGFPLVTSAALWGVILWATGLIR